MKKLEKNKKTLTANFIGPSRKKVDFMFRNKTNAPEVGKYTPNNTITYKNVPKPGFFYDDKNCKTARLKKSKLNFENKDLCSHLVKGLFVNHNRLKKE